MKQPNMRCITVYIKTSYDEALEREAKRKKTYKWSVLDGILENHYDKKPVAKL